MEHIKTTMDVEQFKGYAKSVATCHMDNWGKIFVDEYNQPLEVEEVSELLESGELSLKPKAGLIGADGNIFNIMGIASRALKREGQNEQSKEMIERVFNSKSYDDALSIIMEYVKPVSVDEFY